MYIKDYFLIGDLHSAALVSKKASIDWLCLPHFDSPSIFARILDKNGGCFYVDTGYEIDSAYQQDTAIVLHKFKKNNKSVFMLKDYMVPQQKKECGQHYLVRKFKGLDNTMIRLIFQPRPGYAEQKPNIRYDKGDCRLTTRIGKDTLLVFLPPGCSVIKKGYDYKISFRLSGGQTKSFVMEYLVGDNTSRFSGKDLEKKVKKFWRSWAKKGKYINFCREELVRSAITLKLMQFYPTGAIIASPTTSLPADPGGIRNWDYRYVWIRDATFTLYALTVLGYSEEAKMFFEFIKNIVKKCCAVSPLNIDTVYTIYGEKAPAETVLDRFEGYLGSKPVRIGNNASEQFQIDVYGNLIDMYYFVWAKTDQMPDLDKDILLMLVERIQDLWQEPDGGIWEQRASPKRYTYSRVMCWVGADRIVRLSKKIGLTKDQLDKCKRLRSRIHRWIWHNCYKDGLTQYPGTKSLDATNFLFVMVHFLDKHKKATKKIIEQTCRELVKDEVFVYRYKNSDGLPGSDNAFLICSFWMISAYAVLEDVGTAMELFNKIREHLDHNHLLPEQIDPESKDYTGNFPQAFTHMSLIMSAYYLDKYKKKVS